MERELLGGAEERAGDYLAARDTFIGAAARLDSLPNDGAVALRRAEIAIEDAQIQLHLGDAHAAIARLSPFQSVMEAASPGRFQAGYFKTFGEAFLLEGDEFAAQPFLEQALAVSENGLKSLHRETEKRAWSRAQSELYCDLLEVKLKSNSPREAFAWWEWYKGASLRASDAGVSMQPPNAGHASFVPAQLPAIAYPPATVLVSYALLRNSITVFIFREGDVHLLQLPLPPDLDRRVGAFLALCADPSTELDTLNGHAQQLYGILVAPLEADLGGVRMLRIETDGVLDRIPFNLLRDAAGNYLGDKFKIALSQGIDYDLQSSATSISQHLSPASSALIVVSPGGGDSSLPLLPDAEQEGLEVASYFTTPALISKRNVGRDEIIDRLRSAQVFHFTGHALTAVNRVGLVLGPGVLLNSGDIVNLHPHHLTLAVLSACDSAVGDGGTPADENSIARTLNAAGVPLVVASRWRIDSAVTRELMRGFYAELMSGHSPSDSLFAAASAIRSDPRHRHPYYWASFAVFG